MKNIFKNSLDTRRALKQIAFASMFIPSLASAATLALKNEHTGKVDVYIEPGVGSLMGGQELKYTLKPGEEKRLNISKEEFGEPTEIISVTGKANTPSLAGQNQCSPLSLNESHRVVFVSAKSGGVVCHRSALKK